ncbi:MAG: hypothetical protein CFE24_03285 [Flavobacterium sp. BFFFF2]|nr:MAG: hypothetical protein CFE24_03285 [Flavobacterium sp. BFFFF2]
MVLHIQKIDLNSSSKYIMGKILILNKKFMKKLNLYLVNVIMLFVCNCGIAQINSSEKKATEMLLAYYLKHFKIWETTSLNYSSRFRKLDSLMEKKCTVLLRNKATETYRNVGIDFLTDDSIGNLNENLKVEKDPNIKNGYIVSFISDIQTYADTPGVITKKQIKLLVILIKQAVNYKIAEVKRLSMTQI